MLIIDIYIYVRMKILNFQSMLGWENENSTLEKSKDIKLL